MSDFRSRVEQYMQGRNGADELSIASLEVAVILAIVNLFANNGVVYVIILLLLAYAIFRMVSKDVNRRRKESMAFASRLGPVRPWITNPAAAYRNAREYKHATCPNCHQKVRVPRGKGHIRVTCPRCRQKFDIHS